ncbi:arginine N-succinyltransferase [Endozoicomonas sp.]|nr:arginine N-succinyltransferase [Endozoicomonas sp.]
MLMVRPVNFADLKAIEKLSCTAGATITTLPAEPDHLHNLIRSTQEALSRSISEPSGETYHFVLVESESNKIVGIAGIISAVGITSPFYSYRLEDIVHASDDLEIYSRIPALKLCHDYTGYTCLCTFYISPEVESEEALQLLSRARLLFIAEQRQRFSERIVVELQGVIDEKGRSPFWEDLGRHFFKMDIAHANYLTGLCDKSFIADLMPRHPVYTPLLSKKARSVIGEIRPDRSHVLDLLEQEGFSYEGYVDIFDAGPSLESRIDRLCSVSSSIKTIPEIADTVTGQTHIIANTSTTHFRCISADIDTDLQIITPKIADTLHLSRQSSIRYISTQ